ncbi:MAG: hypothetical protein ACRCYU_16655 [Nocardioides sp.]
MNSRTRGAAAAPVHGSAQGAVDRHLIFVINSAPPYCYDLNQILALPDGFRYRNRFDLAWLAPEIRDDVSALKSHRVLLTLRDMVNSRIIPARWGKLIDAHTIGHIAYFEYTLDETISYSQDAAVRMTEIDARTTKLAQMHSWLPGPKGQPLSDPAVFLSTYGEKLPTAPSRDIAAWGNTASAIASAPIFEGVEFLKIIELITQRGESASVENEGFMVFEGVEYRLRIFQYMPNPGDIQVRPHPIECRTFAEHVVPLREMQQAVGKYDLLTFPIRVKSLPPGETTSLEIPHVPDAATTNRANASLYIPLSTPDVRPTKQLQSLLVLMLSVVLILKPDIIDFLGIGDTTVRNLGMILLVITIAGPSRALAAFWPTWPLGGGK